MSIKYKKRKLSTFLDSENFNQSLDDYTGINCINQIKLETIKDKFGSEIPILILINNILHVIYTRKPTKEEFNKVINSPPAKDNYGFNSYYYKAESCKINCKLLDKSLIDNNNYKLKLEKVTGYNGTEVPMLILINDNLFVIYSRKATQEQIQKVKNNSDNTDEFDIVDCIIPKPSTTIYHISNYFLN